MSDPKDYIPDIAEDDVEEDFIPDYSQDLTDRDDIFEAEQVPLEIINNDLEQGETDLPIYVPGSLNNPDYFADNVAS